MALEPKWLEPKWLALSLEPKWLALSLGKSTKSHLDSSGIVRLGALGQVCCCAFALSRRWRRCGLPWAHFLGLVPHGQRAPKG